MFRMLARLIADPTLTNPAAIPDATTVFATHPVQLSRWLEEAWAGGGIASWPSFTTQNVALGDPAAVARLELPDGLRNDTLRSGIGVPGGGPVIPPQFEPPPSLGNGLILPWDHMIYAYLLESTGIVEILAEVVRRYMVGETLDAPSIDTLVWARGTEELFFRDPPLFHITGLTSQLRPNAGVIRCNGYHRFFGCDLPHQPWGAAPGEQPWKQDAGAVANTRFIELWQELLRQVWMGIENDRNQVGANPTDPSYVAYLCQTLGELLRLRRRGGMLAREEFSAVTMLSWFHLTVEYDTPVVRDLRATAGAAGNPADRLAAIGQRVGIAPAQRSRELFELADLVSPVLWFIELDQFSSPANAETLFRIANVPNPVVAQTMIRIIDRWQSATGERIKDMSVQAGQSAAVSHAQPTRLPSGPAPAHPHATPALAHPAHPAPAMNGSASARRP
jgi:hypothetical protein